MNLGETPTNGTARVRPTVALIDGAAIEHNARTLAAHVAPAKVCAVVKADGYGHGAVTAAGAALRGGASMLAVALVEEAVTLRAAGFTAPILLLSEFPAGAAPLVVAHGLDATVYSTERVAELQAAASATATTTAGPARVHLKVDTGMRRVGVGDDAALDLARIIVSSSGLYLAGVCTHFAASDDLGSDFTAEQLRRLDAVLDALRADGIDPGVVHAANSAGAIAHPAARRDLVRIGVALYGNSPATELDLHTYDLRLRPSLTLRSEVSHVKVVAAGDGVSYGRRWRAPEDRVIATVPIGYADGVPRRLSAVGGEVLVGGRRRAMVGRVTMDQLLIDCGPADPTAPSSGTVPPRPPVQRGDEVILLGTQDGEQITPWEWATKLDTIAYEVTCAISSRVPREPSTPTLDSAPSGTAGSPTAGRSIRD